MIRIKRKSARKFLAILANLSLLLNSFFPLLLTAPAVFAQDFTPTPIIEFTPTPEPTQEPVYDESITPTPDPTEEITITPPPPSDVTPNPSAEPTPTPTPPPELTPTIDPVNSQIGTLTPTTEITPASKKKDLEIFLSGDLAVTSSQTIDSSCMEDAYGKNLQCTANDVSVSDVQLVEILDTCEYVGDTVSFKANWTLLSTATQRYNVGLYFPTQGQNSALNGQCSVSTLPYQPSPPYYDFDNNVCGDISSSGPVTTELTLTVTCLDPDGDNVLNLPYCSSWDQQSGTCSGPTNTVPGSPSKCNCDNGFEIPFIEVPFKAEIEVVKNIIPSSDSGKFNLQINDVTEKADAGNGDTTGKISVGAGTSKQPGDSHSVGETAGTDTNLTNYTSSIKCVDRDLNTFDGGNPLTFSGPGPLTVPVGKDDDIVCTITNTVQNATLTLQKTVINDNGGTAVANDFQAKINGNNVDWGVAQILPTGNYTASELNIPGYLTSVWGGDCASDGSISLAPGDNKTCTITNDDIQPKLTVTKIVSGSDEPASNFSLFVDSTPVISGQTNGFNVGQYVVSETPNNDYNSLISGDCAPDGSITLSVGDDKSCTITNTRKTGNITFIKNVTVGNKLPSEWTFNVYQNDTFVGTYNHNQIVSLKTGSYTVIENGPNSYFLDSISGTACTASNTPGTANLTVSENGGTCIFGNSQKSSITIIKDAQPNSPQDFNFITSGVGISNFTLDDGTDEDGITNSITFSGLLPGAFTISESAVNGWDLTSLSCVTNLPTKAIGPFIGTSTASFNLEAGENVTCTFTNTQKGKIIVEKQTLPNGHTQPFSFTGALTGEISDDQQLFSVVSPGSYTVSESPFSTSGYRLTDISCDDSDSTGNIQTGIASFNVSPGETVKCTFTNEIFGSITAHKFEDINANSLQDIGESDLSGWSMSLYSGFSCNSNNFIKGVNTNSSGDAIFYSIIPGQYSVSETLQNGWTNVTSICQDITITPGQSGVINFANRRVGSITIIKDRVGNSSQQFYFTGDLGEFSLQDDGSILNQKEFNLLSPGSYLVSETPESTTYLDSINCTGDLDGGNSVDLNKNSISIDLDQGENITCTFTNREKGKIIIEKQTLPDGSEQSFEFNPGWSESNFTLTDGQQNNSGWLIPGTYDVSEIVPSGWDQTGAVCSDQSPIDAISLQPGETVTCTFTNTQRGDIQACKYTDYTGNGQYEEGQDTPLSNINFKLYHLDDGWQYLTSQETGLDGCTTFSNLKSADHKYKIVEDYDDPDLDGYYPTNGITYYENIQITPGSTETRIFLNAQYRTIDGFKFNDLNGNATWDDGEPGLQNWIIFIDSNSNGLLDGGEISTTTDENGFYEFTNLVADSYRIAEKLESDWTQTLPTLGYYDIDLHTALSSSNNNFGNVQLSDIHGYKWHDLDNNGQKDIAEPLLSDWTINLYRFNGEGYLLIDSMITDDEDHFGWYWFENLIPGDYQICEYLKDGWQQTYPIDDSGYCHKISLPQDKSSNWSVNMVAGPEYNFGNIQFGSVEVTKFNDVNGNGQFDEGEDQLSGWDINLSDTTQTTGENGKTVFDQLLPSTYYLSEDLQPGWEQTNIYCINQVQPEGVLITKPNWAFGHHGNCSGWNTCGDAATCALKACQAHGYNQLVSYGESRPCTQFENCSLFHDINQNLNYQELWGNWCDVMGVTDIYCGNGNNGIIPTPTTPDLVSGQNFVKQVNAVASPNGQNNYRIDLSAGQNLTCFVGNQFIKPQLTISKFNNRWPATQSIGSEIEYTITLNVSENNIKDVSVVDLPPLGFKYKSGSYQVLVNGVPRSIPEPVYSSPGTWKIGDLSVGDVVTLSYLAIIQNSVDAGTYKDAAWAFGVHGDSKILASSVNSGKIDPGILTNTFVGTQIKIDPTLPGQPVDLAREGQVLGASTTLPATGASTIWMIVFAILSALGISTLYYGFKPKRKNMAKNLIIIILISLFSIVPAKSTLAAQSENIYIGLENPITPTNQNSFNLSFTTLDILNRPLTVKCYKINPDFSETQIGSDIAVKSGGNSGNCSLENNRLSESGKTYRFYAIAFADGESYRSDTVLVDYNTNAPGTPAYYKKESEGTCRYKISFEASNDGKTTRIEIYRSDLTSFIADSGSKIGEVGISPGQKGSFTDVNLPDCKKTYYYVIRAFDSANNGSNLTGDYFDVITTTSSDTTGSVIPAIPILGDDSINQTPISDEEITDELDEGTILGSESDLQNTYSKIKTWVEEDHPLLAIAGTFLLVFVILYVFGKFFKKKR